MNKVLGFTVLFVFGWLCSSTYAELSNLSLEMPLSFSKARERASPYDWIEENQVRVYKDRVVVNIDNAEFAAFANTNSMDPLIDEKANAVEIVPKSEKDIHVGDIISYEYEGSVIIHRVIKIGNDKQGWYVITKGDNSNFVDPDKVRFEQIKRVLVMIIY